MSIELLGAGFDDSIVHFDAPISLVLRSRLTRPYDELTAEVFPAKRRLRRVLLRQDGETLFDGLVVTQSRTDGPPGSMRLVCRSAPGYRMTEKQLNPYVYFRVTGESIVEDFAVPCGAAGVRLDENRSINIMLVSERETYWDYLTAFFVQAYGKVPYIGRDLYLSLTPFTGRSYTVSPVGSGLSGLHCLELSERFHTRGIAAVHFYTGSDDFGNLYGEHFPNPAAASYGFQRELYVNPNRSWVLEHERYADYLFYRESVDSRAVRVTIAGWHPLEPGDAVTLVQGGESESLYVGEVTASAGKNGAVTVVDLWDPARHPLL